MEIVCRELLDRFELLHVEMTRAIEGLPQGALDWAPGPDINSICVLAVHTAASQRYWVGDVVGQDSSGRNREAEFVTQGLDGQELNRRLEAALEHTRGVLGRLTAQELTAVYTSPRDGRQFTAAWAIAHALEHTAIHVGHVQITRQWWEQRQAGSG